VVAIQFVDIASADGDAVVVAGLGFGMGAEVGAVVEVA